MEMLINKKEKTHEGIIKVTRGVFDFIATLQYDFTVWFSR